MPEPPAPAAVAPEPAPPDPLPVPTWASRYVVLATTLAAVAFVSVWVAASYLDVAPTEAVVFQLADQWCSIPSQSVGRHCFGDYAIVDQYFSGGGFFGTRNAWDWEDFPTTIYPGLAWLPALTAFRLGEALGGGRTGAFLFIALQTACLLVPAVWAGWGRWRSALPICVALLGIASTPLLATVDRGNSTALVVPFLTLFAVAAVRRRYWWVCVAIVGAAVLRPQFAVLALLLLANRRYRELLVAALGTLGLTTAGFAIFPGFPRNVLAWVESMLGYSDSQSAGVPYPTNLGFGRSLVGLVDLVGLGAAIGPANRTALVNALDANGMLLDFLAIAAVAVVLVLAEHRLDPTWSVMLSLFAVLYASSTVYLYYSVVMLPVAALVLRSPASGRGDSPPGWRGVLDDGGQRRSARVAAVLTVVVTAVVMAPVVLPPRMLPAALTDLWALGSVPSVYQALVGPLLLVLFVAVLVAAASVARDPAETHPPARSRRATPAGPDEPAEPVEAGRGRTGARRLLGPWARRLPSRSA